MLFSVCACVLLLRAKFPVQPLENPIALDAQHTTMPKTSPAQMQKTEERKEARLARNTCRSNKNDIQKVPNPHLLLLLPVGMPL